MKKTGTILLLVGIVVALLPFSTWIVGAILHALFCSEPIIAEGIATFPQCVFAGRWIYLLLFSIGALVWTVPIGCLIVAPGIVILFMDQLKKFNK